MAKRAVILQPSFLPWRGVFDLIYRSDVFVFLDDVQYDKNSWRNRNVIKTPQGALWITVPILTKGKFPLPLLEAEISNQHGWAQKMLKSIQQNYSKAHFFKEYYPLLSESLSREWTSLVELDINLTVLIMGFLGLKKELVRSSELGVSNADRNGRLLEICGKLRATHYLSGPSAKDYIDEKAFQDNGTVLEYAEYAYPPYPQLYGDFVPQVSIIDLLFNCGPQAPEWIWGAREKTSG